jgi:hypothetical protein
MDAPMIDDCCEQNWSVLIMRILQHQRRGVVNAEEMCELLGYRGPSRMHQRRLPTPAVSSPQQSWRSLSRLLGVWTRAPFPVAVGRPEIQMKAHARLEQPALTSASKPLLSQHDQRSSQPLIHSAERRLDRSSSRDGQAASKPAG